MEKAFLSNGYEYISALIEDARCRGLDSVTVDKDLIIDREVRIPSDFTLILDSCHLKMADGCYSNMFVNENHGTDIGRTVEGRDRNIRIIGKNGALLDGGKYNMLSEKTQLKNGLPPIWKNNLILFTNVDGFEVSGLSCHNQRWWALNFVYCANGRIFDIDFKACDIMVDENGVETHGLKHEKYADILVKNADGIDLRRGCHDILIENISGFTEDDSVALTGLFGRLEKEFAVEGLSSDIYNVRIKNIATSAFCTNVRLLNQGGVRLHDIEIDNVTDMSKDCPYMEKGIYGVRIGDTHLYGSRHATSDETYNISVRNVHSRAMYAAISLAGDMRDVVIENVEALEGTRELEDKRTSN